MRKRFGPRGIVGAVVFLLVGINEGVALFGRANLLDRILSHLFGSQVTPSFNLFVMVFGLLLILIELRRTPDADSGSASPRRDRPRVKLSTAAAKGDDASAIGTVIEATNDSDVAAMSVFAEVAIPDTSYSIRIGPISQVVKGTPQRLVPELLDDGKPWQWREVSSRFDTFLAVAHKAKGCGSVAAFDVTYTNHDRESFTTRHILKFTPWDQSAPGAFDNLDVPRLQIYLAGDTER